MPRKLFPHISKPTSCLHHLLPDPRGHSVIPTLRLTRNIIEYAIAPSVTAPLYSRPTR